MPVCENCGKEGAQLRCGRCRESWYCSPACQKEHWKAGHKSKCVKAESTPSAAPAASAAQAPSAARAPSAAQVSAATPLAPEGGEECPICYDVMLMPQKMPCSHKFCLSCFERMRKLKVGQKLWTCPLCRGPMPEPQRLFSKAAQMQRILLPNNVKIGAGPAPERIPLRLRVATLDKMEVHLREAIEIDPALAPAHMMLIWTLGERGKAQEAIDAAIQAAKVVKHNKHNHSVIADMLFNLGVKFTREGDQPNGKKALLEAGKDALLKAVEVYPEHGRALAQLGFIALAYDDRASALEYLEKANECQLDPKTKETVTENIRKLKTMTIRVDGDTISVSLKY